MNPILPLHIDSTMRSAFVSCSQKFYNEFVLGLRPEQPSLDLHAGACFATALETVYKAVHLSSEPMNQALERGHAAFATEWGDFVIPDHKIKRTAKTFDRMWEAIEDYFRQYPPLTDHVQPYFAADGKPTFEYTFAIPLEPACNPRAVGPDGYFYGMEETPVFPLHPSGSPFVYCGRFDMLGLLRDSARPCVRDEKTTGSSIGQLWADQWNLRGQFMGYVWACQQGGIPLDTVVIRGIAIQKTQIVHAEAIKPYNAFMLDRWREQLRRDLWRLRRCFDSGYWDYDFAEACNAYGGCVFRDLCASRSPERWMDHFRIHRWNPLEKNPVKEPEAVE